MKVNTNTKGFRRAYGSKEVIPLSPKGDSLLT